MPFSTVKPLLVKAEALLDQLQLRQLDGLLDICALGLGHLALEVESYHNMVSFCVIIMPHFENELVQLVRILETCHTAKGAESAKARFGEIQERAFCLVEDMALFAREKKLRSGCVRQAEADERLTAYFETSGQWPPEQKTLVADMYYVQIPAAVLAAPFAFDSHTQSRDSLPQQTA